MLFTAISKSSEKMKLFPFSIVKEQEQPEALMLKAKLGDTKAFAMLYERYKSPIFSYLRGFSPRDAEDMLQDTFIKAYRARESYEPKARFSTWIWTIARNVAFDNWKKHKEVLEFDGEENSEISSIADEALSAESILVEQADRVRIDRCIESLPRAQKEALLLRTFAEFSYEEIAIELSESLGNVKTLIYRAKEGLTQCLRKH
jgi:RNA polymerase sigma-70 factor (ECF subfamily)